MHGGRKRRGHSADNATQRPALWRVRFGQVDVMAISRGRTMSKAPILRVADIRSVHTASRLRRTAPGRRTLSMVFSVPERRGSRSTSSKYDPLIAISALVRSARISAGIRRSCGFSRRPGSRDAGISVGRSTTRNRRPSTLQLAYLALQIGDHLPIRQPAIVQPFRERGHHGAGANSTRFALTRPAKSSICSTVSRASSASLIFRPSRPLEAPLTAQLRLSEAEADATCEHQRNRAGEAVLVGLNLGASICVEIQCRIPYVMREWTGSRRE
jgi:hypothetical protein